MRIAGPGLGSSCRPSRRSWLLIGGVVRDLRPALALTACGIYGVLRARLGVPASLSGPRRAMGRGLCFSTLAIAALNLQLGQVRRF